MCQILAVLPASSVECERGFSLLNRIKSVDRNKLSQDHLENLIRIASTNMNVSILIDKPSKSLIARWKQNKLRRSGEKADSLLPVEKRPHYLQ